MRLARTAILIASCSTLLFNCTDDKDDIGGESQPCFVYSVSFSEYSGYCDDDLVCNTGNDRPSWKCQKPKTLGLSAVNRPGFPGGSIC